MFYGSGLSWKYWSEILTVLLVWEILVHLLPNSSQWQLYLCITLYLYLHLYFYLYLYLSIGVVFCCFGHLNKQTNNLREAFIQEKR